MTIFHNHFYYLDKIQGGYSYLKDNSKELVIYLIAGRQSGMIRNNVT